MSSFVTRPVCPAAQAANFGLLDLQLTEADRRPFKLPLQLGELPIVAQAIHSRFDDDERRRKAAIDATRSEHFARDQADLQKMTYNARTENAQPRIGPKGQPPDPNLGPTTSDPNVGATATGSPAAIPRERLFQRVWPRMMIGVMFVLEVAWIVFLVHSSIALVRFLLKR